MGNLTETQKTIISGEVSSTDAASALPRHRGDGREDGEGNMPAGAPAFVWTREIEDEILDHIMNGRSFRDFLVKNRAEHLPSVPTFFKRIREDDSFAERYARAREFQADCEFEEIAEIADNGSNDWMENNDPDNPGYRLNGEHVQRSRLRVDARKWRASKLAPKKYGERLDMTHANPDGSALTIKILRLGNAEEEDA